MNEQVRIAILEAENEKLKKKVRELEHIRILNQSTIMNLRRQIEWYEVEHNV